MKTVRQTTRAWGLGGAVAVLAVATVAAFVVPDTASARVVLTTASVSLISPAVATNPSVSADGRFVVFASAPAVADGRTSSVWLSDRTTGVLTQLTNLKNGVRIGNSVAPVISADGCAVVVTTEMAFDLFRDDDTGKRWDIYRATLGQCGGKPNDWQLVSSVSFADGQGQARGDVDPTQPAAISSSGSIVAYARPFKSLSGRDDLLHRPSAIEVVDLSTLAEQPGHSTQAAGLPAETSGNSAIYLGQRNPALSGDGRFVVFSSDATSNEAVPEWVNPAVGSTSAVGQIFAWDRTNADPFTAVALISHGPTGPANASASNPTVSADGRLVSFASKATNLVSSPSLDACGKACPSQIYAVDRDANNNFVFDETDSTVITPATPTSPSVTETTAGTSISLVSRVPAAPDQPIIAADGESNWPTMSGDGNTIAFSTQATNLLAVRTPGGGDLNDGDLIVADLGTFRLHRAFDGPSPAAGAHANARLSANGRVLVADTIVANQLLTNPAIVGRHVVAVSFAPTLSMAHADLGTVTVNVPGPEWYVNVVNDGPGAFVPDAITSDNTDFAVSGGSCLDRSAVPAGKSCSVNVMLTPSATGTRTGTLTVAEAGFGALSISTPLTGSGGEPALEAAPAGLDFAPTVVGQYTAVSSTNIISVHITAATVRMVKITGQNPDDFTIGVNGCKGQVIEPTGCPIEVSFNPTAGGRRTATLNVGIAAGQYTSIFLSGEGVYNPSVITTATRVAPGRKLGIDGRGFPANAGVLIGWSDGSGRPTIAITDITGSFVANMLVLKNEHPGPRTLVAQVLGGPLAATTVTIDRPTTLAPGSAAWPRP